MDFDDDDEFDLSNVVPDPNDGCTVEEILAALDDDGPAGRRGNPSQEDPGGRPSEVIKLDVARSNELMTTTAHSLSNKVTRRLRRSDSKDRQIIDGIRTSVAEIGPEGTVALAGDFHTSILTTSWEHTGDRVKLAFANEALELHGSDNREAGARPVSWTLNLSPERLTKALKHDKGFVGCLSGLINRALDSGLGYVARFAGS